MRSASLSMLAATLAIGISAGCARSPQSSPAPTEVGLPNPASVYCEGQDGRLEIRTDASGGQIGICVLPDGSECEEWALFRNECQPGSPPSATAAPAESPTLDPSPAPPAGWESFTHPSLFYSFHYPAGSTFESSDPDRYTLVVGPLEGDEHWPWFNIAHPDQEDYHPPADAALQTWLAERSRLPGEVLGTRTIAGETAIHTRFDDPRGPQSYSDDRYYFVHGGQLYELTLLHTGKEDWAVYDQFLDSLHFQD